MSTQQRLTLIAAILASFVAFLDGFIVNVALPAITRELGGGLALQQWVVDAYLITLGALILLAGSLSDAFGRRRVLSAGLIGFGAASVLCAVAPSGLFLITARALQGIAGALIVPSSLALIIAAFPQSTQGKAIGSWTAWTGIASIIGPLLGGLLVDAVSWRLIFAINLLPIAVTLLLLRRIHTRESSINRGHLDIIGAVLCALGLGGPVYSLIEQAHYGWTSPLIYLPLIIGLAMFATFLFRERRTPRPMLPLDLFHVRNFSLGNLATVAIYAGLSLSSFVIIVFLQQTAGYSAVQAGLSFLPVTLIMFALSPRFGALASTYGPRWFMATGPIICAAGFLTMLGISHSVAYWSQLFPGIVLFGLGLSITVAPLTTAVLSSIHPRQAGIGSAINNAVSRIAGLIAIAALSLITGPTLSLLGFHRGLIAIALLLVAGGLISALGIRNARAAA